MNSKITLFVDDTTVIIKSKEKSTINSIATAELDKLVKCFNINSLMINFAKTNVLNFTNRQNSTKTSNNSLILDSSGVIKPVNSTVYLGLTIQ